MVLAPIVPLFLKSMGCPTLDWLWLKSDTPKFNTYNWTLHHPWVKSDSFIFLKKSYKGPSFKWAQFQNNSCKNNKVTIFFWNSRFLGPKWKLLGGKVGLRECEHWYASLRKRIFLQIFFQNWAGNVLVMSGSK